MKPQLVCVSEGARRRYTLEGDEAVVGREGGLPLCLPLEGVSRRHLRIRRDERGWWLEDLQSTNGTFLNGQRTSRGRLRHLDVITLGRAADMVFVLRADVRSSTRRGIVRAALVAEPSGLKYEVAPGEATLGRAAACNLVFDHESVSKLHARLERTTDQLVLRDLGSANGTFVNGRPVQVAVLKDGDVVALAAAEPLRVMIALGDVVSGSDVRVPRSTAPPPAAEPPAFSPEWKTRYEWDADELAIFEAVRRGQPPPPNKTLPLEEEAPPPAKPSPSVPTRRVAAVPPRTAARSPALISAVRLRGTEVDLSISAPGAYLIGRSPEVPLRIEHNTVSRRHASLILSEDRTALEVRDEGAANGTFVNGAAIKTSHPLADGDTLLVGHVPLRVHIARGSAS